MDIQYFVVSSFFSIRFYKHWKFQLVGSVKVMWLQAVTCVTWSHNYDKRCNGVERAGKINEGWRLRLRLWVSPHVIYNCCFCDTPCNYHQKGRSSNWGIKPFWEVLKADWISCYHQLLNDGGLGAEVMLVGLFNMTTGTNIDVSVCPGPPPPAPPPHSSDILYCLSSFAWSKLLGQYPISHLCLPNSSSSIYHVAVSYAHKVGIDLDIWAKLF